MEETFQPFDFKQCVSIIKATGKKALDIHRLRELIATISNESIFHHTCQYFLKGHILEYTNDFSQWIGESLEERALAERISSIDPYTFKSVNGVREQLLKVIDDYLKFFPEPRSALPGQHFYFNETITLIFPVGIKAKNLAEFLVALEHVEPGCLYFHFYESRVRLGEGVDDFTRWIEHTLHKKSLADEIRKIDPFMHSIEKIREHILEIVDAHVRLDMEGFVS